MPEFIEREAAVKIAEKYGLTDGTVLGRHTGLADCIASEIDSLPASDVAPVVHARWIARSDKGIISMTHPYMCSRCWRVEMDKEPYCNCGAKMDGGVE